MPLTLVLGPANSAKAGEIFAAHEAAVPRGALLVVPTAADADYYGRDLVLGSVLTFSGLAHEIARRASYDARPLTTLQRDRVLARVARESQLRAAATPGFASAAGGLIEELERSLITPQRFAAALHAWAAQDRRRASYAEELAALYRRYTRELELLHRVDGDLYAWRALDALRAAPGSWGNDPVFFYGFDDFHPLQRDAVETLAGVVGVEVTVSLTYESGRTAFAARAETVQELAPIATEIRELPALDAYYEHPALHHLERSLFEPQPERVDPEEAVQLLEAGGELAEAELVAAEVLGLLRAGVRPEEVAIVARSPAVLERVCAWYGVPVAGERKIPFGHTALGRAVLALVRGDGIAYLRFAAEPEVVDELEQRRCREGVPPAVEEVDAVAQAADPAAELLRQGHRLLAAGRAGRAPVLDRDSELDARALSTLARAVEELSELGEVVSGRELMELLEALRVPVRSLAGGVLIADPLAVRARRFRAVFVCGLQEGEFPVPATVEPLLPDEHRRELAAVAGLRLRTGEGTLARERYLFYACLSRANERVVLSYRSSDEEGNLALPSPFVADVADVLVPEWPERRRRRLLADVVWPIDEAPTERERARSLAARRTGAIEAPELHLGDAALAHVRHREIVSGGALEAYAECPVKWLVERELQPAALEPDPEPLARGSYMHAALEEVLRRLGRALTLDALPRAFEILDEVMRELPAAVAPGRSAGVRAGALRSIEADLRRYLEHEANDGCAWPPQALELRFGFDEERSLPALELDGVRVRGVIDRVDVAPDGRRAIVRDYKTGSTRPEYQGARWRLDHQLQVALYMLAVRELLGLEPVAGLYQPVGGNDLRARGVFRDDAVPGSCLVANDGRDAEGIAEELEAASATAVALAARLRAGELTPCPDTCSRDGCRYPAICRVT
jgi:ATP-dependent helicase/DNAse subunit B